MGNTSLISQGDKPLVIIFHFGDRRCACISFFGVYLPELGLESLSKWTVPPESGVGGESRSEDASQERVDHRELLPLPDEDWTVTSPELLRHSSVLL